MKENAGPQRIFFTLAIRSVPRSLFSVLGELRVEEDPEFCGSLISMPLSCWSPPVLLSNFTSPFAATVTEDVATTAGVIVMGFSQALTAGAGAGRGMPMENGVLIGVLIGTWELMGGGWLTSGTPKNRNVTLILLFLTITHRFTIFCTKQLFILVISDANNTKEQEN